MIRYSGTILLMVTLAIIFVSKGHAQQPRVNVDENTIYWGKPGFEPMYIASGANLNHGIGDLIILDLGKLLPQYKHEVMLANYPRVVSELRSGSNICAILHRTPEREEFIHYSNTLILSPANQLYISASAKNRYQHLPGWSESKVSFNDFLANNEKLRMALIPSHSYGRKRDAIIHRYRNNMIVTKGYAGQEALIKMLLAERVDLIMEFPWVINHQLQKLKLNSSLLHKITLTDVPAYETAHIACPKTPWGKQIVTEINNLDPPIHIQTGGYIESWLEPAEVEGYRRANIEYFGEGWLQDR